jgi:hypothetical protein
MVSRNLEQLLARNSRLKFELDSAARIQQAREEGQLEGRIHLLRELLGLPKWTDNEFSTRDAAELRLIADQLQQQLLARGD